MKLEFRTDEVICLGIWECVEIMVISDEIIRYRVNGKISRPCKIYSTLKDNRPYFRYGNIRLYLDQGMRPR